MSHLSLTRGTGFKESLKHLSCCLLVNRVIILEELGGDLQASCDVLRHKTNAQTALYVSLGRHHDMVGVTQLLLYDR